MCKCRKALEIAGYLPLHIQLPWYMESNWEDVFRARSNEDSSDELSAETEYHHDPNKEDKTH